MTDALTTEMMDMMANAVPHCKTHDEFKRVLKEALATFAAYNIVEGERMSFDLNFTCDHESVENISLNVTFDDTPK